MRTNLRLALLPLLGLAACGNPATPAGFVGYLTRGAIVGKASYVGLQTGPTSYGASWLVKVMNVSVTPFSYAEDFSGDSAVLTKDKLMVSLRAHIIPRRDVRDQAQWDSTYQRLQELFAASRA